MNQQQQQNMMRMQQNPQLMAQLHQGRSHGGPQPQPQQDKIVIKLFHLYRK